MGNGRFLWTILNYIGGTARYIYGSIWRSIFKRKKYKYSEYLNGPKNPNLHDQIGHNFNNAMIGGIILFGIIIPLVLKKF